MPKRPRTSLAYRHFIRMETDDWLKTQVRERDEAARKAREAERSLRDLENAAVLAELERNKERKTTLGE